jgi:hypothetical protein
MFERYTERARRVIFFARYETSTFGSRTIETEHFLLGLLREETNLLQRLLERPDIHEEMRARIKARITAREKISTSIDLPLSDPCKRILKYSEEEAEKLGHHFIGTEHLLLGILREKGCLAAELLEEAGVSLDKARESIAKSSLPEGRSPTIQPSPFTGDLSLDALMVQLPEDRLRWLKVVVEKLLRGEPDSLTEERTSSIRRTLDGSVLVETRQSIGRHQITVREQFQLSPDGKTLRYAHEVTGSRPEQRRTQSYEFDVNPN